METKPLKNEEALAENLVEAEQLVVEEQVEEIKVVKADQSTRSEARRPEGIVLTAVYHFLMAIPGLLIGLLFLTIPIPVVIMTVDDAVGLTAALVSLVLLTLVFAGSGLLYVIAGIGLLRTKNWARWLAIGLAMVMLLFVPIGTLLGAAVIIYLLSEEVRRVFSS